ncbi:MAG: alpha-amylase family glycosyl hydrolase [Myxococcota bacterium]|jgi:glycosidase|nr:alpha-amylase family glycosyl hydrolase [Myxococcota bacterium]
MKQNLRPRGSHAVLVCLAVLGALLSACLGQTPRVVYEKAVSIDLMMLRDDTASKSSAALPEQLSQAISEELSVRNLKARAVAFADFEEDALQVRDSERRLARFAEQRGDAELVVLVETRAVFYSQLSGRYRWTVYAKLSVADRNAPDSALVESFDLPAVLTYDHEREDDALELVGPELARRVGLLVDAYLSGHSAAAAAQQHAKRAHSRAQSVYFVLVDRFANGDPSNDGVIDSADPAAWHGGDLRGVLERLDHLDRLGVESIWLSPIFQARDGDFMGHGAFHGYWTEDLRQLDPRFGTADELRELVDAAHARGMRVLLDLVVNHVGYQAPLLSEHPDWFHDFGSIQNWNDAHELVVGEVHGLPDLAQENPEVYAYLLEASKGWLELGIDGFRLDAVKHVSLDFWSRFNQELLTLRPDLVLLGELFDGSPRSVNDYQRLGHFTHMFDFPMAFALRDVFCDGKSVGHIAAVMSNDRLYTEPSSLVTFLDNHDMSRVLSACGGELSRVRHALTAQLSVRGIPAINYGLEAGLEGEGEPENRADMRFDAGHELEAHLSTLLGLRGEWPALVEGSTRILHFDEDFLVFLRAAPDSLALVAINSGAQAQSWPLPEALSGLAWSDPLAGEPIETQLRCAPGATRLVLARVEGDGRRLLPEPSQARRWVELNVAVDAGAQLYVVGSAPELGQWNPAEGLGPLTSEGERSSGRFELPVGTVLAYKLVALDDAETRWESGENRYLFVAEGSDALRLELSFRAP